MFRNVWRKTKYSPSSKKILVGTMWAPLGNWKHFTWKLSVLRRLWNILEMHPCNFKLTRFVSKLMMAWEKVNKYEQIITITAAIKRKEPIPIRISMLFWDSRRIHSETWSGKEDWRSSFSRDIFFIYEEYSLYFLYFLIFYFLSIAIWLTLSCLLLLHRIRLISR